MRARRVSSGRVAREGRQERAAARQAEAEGRTPSDRLAALDARLGAGEGAQHERARLESTLTTTKRKARR